MIFVRTLEHRLYQIDKKEKIRRDEDFIYSLTKHGEKVLCHRIDSDNIFNRMIQEIDRQLLLQDYVFIDLEKII